MGMFILQFLVLTFVISGVIIFFLHRMLISSTQGAVRRLNTETEGARAKQAELNQKIKEADEELAKRKQEAEKVVKKMMEDGEEFVKQEREKIINKARTEAEEIITKAHRTRDAVRQEIQKELEVKLVDRAVDILKQVLGHLSVGAVSDRLIDEFLEKLQDVDSSQIPHEVQTIDVFTATDLSDENKNIIKQSIIKKLNRNIDFSYQIDSGVVGGVLLKFGSLVLDGSLRNAMVEAAAELKTEIEKG